MVINAERSKKQVAIDSTKQTVQKAGFITAFIGKSKPFIGVAPLGGFIYLKDKLNEKLEGAGEAFEEVLIETVQMLIPFV